MAAVYSKTARTVTLLRLAKMGVHGHIHLCNNAFVLLKIEEGGGLIIQQGLILHSLHHL